MAGFVFFTQIRVSRNTHIFSCTSKHSNFAAGLSWTRRNESLMKNVGTVITAQWIRIVEDFRIFNAYINILKIYTNSFGKLRTWSLWFFFCHLPPAMLLFHLLSDHWWQYKKCFRKLSLILQNSIAPSLCRGRLHPWRRRWTLDNRIATVFLVQHQSKFSPE